MNILEEAIIYSTVMHTGAVRKGGNKPYILHPLEVAQIISTYTDDIEVITAGVLHDVVEDTDGSLDEIRARFGNRVADLVASETENKYENEDKALSWKKRKEETLLGLENTKDIGVKMLWLGDKLSNIRSLAGEYAEEGEAVWDKFNQKDPNMHKWYYKTIAEYLEIDLNRTGAFKEFINFINYIWPGTFENEKTRYKKYREYSVEGCPVIGRGAKGTVYRYDDELVIKVYNANNTYKDIELENSLARKAFVAGIPTAISFGIVKVGDCYGSMFELLKSDSISDLIAKDPSRAAGYGEIMAKLAADIHAIDGSEMKLDEYITVVYDWVENGICWFDEKLGEDIKKMIDALPHVTTVIHGDFHTGNVMMEKGEPIIIDMDRLSIGHPIIELSGLYQFYIANGELNHRISEDFMGYSYAKQAEFFNEFMKCYLKTDDEERIKEVTDKAAVLAYARCIKRLYKNGINLSEAAIEERDYYYEKIKKLLETVKTLDF